MRGRRSSVEIPPWNTLKSFPKKNTLSKHARLHCTHTILLKRQAEPLKQIGCLRSSFSFHPLSSKRDSRLFVHFFLSILWDDRCVENPSSREAGSDIIPISKRRMRTCCVIKKKYSSLYLLVLVAKQLKRNKTKLHCSYFLNGPYMVYLPFLLQIGSGSFLQKFFSTSKVSSISTIFSSSTHIEDVEICFILPE